MCIYLQEIFRKYSGNIQKMFLDLVKTVRNFACKLWINKQNNITAQNSVCTAIIATCLSRLASRVCELTNFTNMSCSTLASKRSKEHGSVSCTSRK